MGVYIDWEARTDQHNITWLVQVVEFTKKNSPKSNLNSAYLYTLTFCTLPAHQLYHRNNNNHDVTNNRDARNNSKVFFYLLFINTSLKFLTVRLHIRHELEHEKDRAHKLQSMTMLAPAQVNGRMGARDVTCSSPRYVFFWLYFILSILMSFLRINYTYEWRRQERQVDDGRARDVTGLEPKIGL